VLGRILISLGGLLVIALFTALLAPFFIDWSDFRREFEDQASRILGKKVVVHGTVEARLLPFPSVTLNDVRAGVDADGNPLLQAARFSMDAELAPFLSGEMRIFDMRIEEPKARIRLLSDGTLEWTRGSRSQLPGSSIVLESVKIERGDIEFIDEQSGRNRHLTDLNMQMSADNLFGPWRADGDAKIDGVAGRFTLATGQPDVATGRLAMRLKLMPQDYPIDFDLDGALTAREGKPLYAGNFAMNLRKTDNANAAADGGLLSNPRTRGAFELSNDRIRVPSYQTELGTADSPYVVTGEATLDTGAKPEFLLTADGQQIDVGRLVGSRVQPGKTDRVQKLTVKQRVEALAEIIARIPVPQVPGKATISLPAIISDGTNIRDIRLDVRPQNQGWQVVSAVATLPGRTQLEADGILDFSNGPSFQGDLLVASNQPTGLASWLTGEVDPAIRTLAGAGFSSKVHLDTNKQTFDDLEIAIGNASLLGRYERQTTQDATHSVIDLNGDEVNLDALRAIATLALGEPIGTSMLEQTVDASLKASRLNIGGVVAQNVDTQFSLAGGRINIAKFNASDVAGADIKLTGDVSGTLADYSGKGKLELAVKDAAPFADFLAKRIPQHTLITKLQQSASWYKDTNLVVDLSLSSEKGGVNAAISGTINGSRISSVAKLPDFTGLTDETALTLDVVLKNASTSILFGQAGFNPLPIDADGEGLLSLKLSGEIGAPVSTEVNFSTERTRFSLKGEHRLNAENFGEGQSALTLESADFEPFLMMNSIPAPQIGTGLPVKLSANLTADSKVMVIDALKGNLAGNNLSARLERPFAANAPISGQIGVDYLDLAWLSESTFGPINDAMSGAVNSNSLMMASFDGLSANIALTAKNFAADPFGMMADMKSQLTVSNSTLALQDFSANWLGGEVSGKLSMSSVDGNGVISSAISLRNASHLPSTWLQADTTPRASAQYDADLSVESSGKSASELLNNATGNGQMALRSPVLNAFDAAVFPKIIALADQIDKDVTIEKVMPIVDSQLWQGQTQFADATFPLVLSNGSLKLQGAKLTASGMTLDLDGAMTLEDFALSGTAQLALEPGTEALKGAMPNLKLAMGGTLFNPEIVSDVTELTGFIGLRAFEKERRRVEALQASIQEKQRLRREAALYAERERERKAKAEAELLRQQQEEAARIEALRLEEEQRLAAEKLRLEEEARQRALIEQQQRAIEQSAKVPPSRPSSGALVPTPQPVLRFDLPEIGTP
jgi:uncharacterized protein involved in outer membrane biogenesis